MGKNDGGPGKDDGGEDRTVVGTSQPHFKIFVFFIIVTVIDNLLPFFQQDALSTTHDDAA